MGSSSEKQFDPVRTIAALKLSYILSYILYYIVEILNI